MNGNLSSIFFYLLKDQQVKTLIICSNSNKFIKALSQISKVITKNQLRESPIKLFHLKEALINFQNTSMFSKSHQALRNCKTLILPLRLISINSLLQLVERWKKSRIMFKHWKAKKVILWWNWVMLEINYKQLKKIALKSSNKLKKWEEN